MLCPLNQQPMKKNLLPQDSLQIINGWNLLSRVSISKDSITQGQPSYQVDQEFIDQVTIVKI